MPPISRIAYIACIVLCGSGLTASAQIDRARAQQYFTEAQAACSRDHGKLWGISLCGPLMFVDPQSREVVANQADAESLLHKEGTLFVGTFPKGLNVANTAVTWAGTQWTQLRWPVGGNDTVARQSLLAHEMFHRVQTKLGLSSASPANAHLDTEEGRFLLRAEMRALRQALLSKGRARQEAAQDALLFRAARRTAFAAAGKEETALELNEGLCEYTGIRLSRSSASDRRQAAAEALAQADKSNSYVRSFAYATGPAYGLLLDEWSRAWRRDLLVSRERGLESLLGEALKYSPPDQAAAPVAKGDYGLAELRAQETDRRRKQEARLAEAKARFVDGPVLAVPLTKANVQFDPNTLYTFAGYGTIYPEIRIADEWGILTVKSGGALLASDWSKVTVSATADGWELELNPGWSKKPAVRAGDLTVSKD